MKDRAKIQIKWKGMHAFQRFLYDDEELLVDDEFLDAPWVFGVEVLFVFGLNATFFREMFALATRF